MTSTNSDRITDDYDRRAYEQMLREATRARGRISRAADRVSDAVGSAGRRVVGRFPAAATDAMQQAIGKMLSGLRQLVIEPAFRTVFLSRVRNAYGKAGHSVEELQAIVRCRYEPSTR